MPTRPNENPLEYVPTQYLCEFVKSLGVGGIRYRSSLRPEGWNIVLFDPTRAQQVHDVQHFRLFADEGVADDAAGVGASVPG